MKANNKFKLYQENNNGNNEFYNNALKNIQDSTPLSRVYFSKKNIDMIQNIIRYQVWIQSDKKHTIGRQSDLQLQIIMRSYYLQYSQNLSYNIKEQVTKLNNLVIDESVSTILTNVEQYIAYKKAVSTIPEPIARPKYLSSAGTKTLQPTFGFN